MTTYYFNNINTAQEAMDMAALGHLDKVKAGQMIGHEHPLAHVMNNYRIEMETTICARDHITLTLKKGKYGVVRTVHWTL